MSDINPFAQPPLVEWENCWTIDELSAMLNGLILIYNRCKWYQYKKKFTIETMIKVVKAQIEWVYEGKPETLGGLQ